MTISRLTCSLLLAALFCASAQAQYVWIDEKGNKQFSDMPPPKSTPKDKIIKSPGVAAKSANADDKTPAPAANAPAKLEKPDTIASKNEDFNKRKAEQADKDKKADAEQQAASEKAKNCERARSNQQTLASGARISRTDKNGEKYYIDDDQRQKELEDAKKSLAGCQP